MPARLGALVVVVLLALSPVAAVLAAVTVTTGAATDITANTATLNGSLGSLDTYSSVDLWFEYGPTSAYGTLTARENRTAAAGPGAFSASITGLTAGTIYYFRAAAQGVLTGATTVYGVQGTFTTPVPSLAATTLEATSVTTIAATLNGSATWEGTIGAVQVWFEWGTDTTYGSTTDSQTLSAPGGFSAAINISARTTYHYRAVAQVGTGGTVHGDDGLVAAATAPALNVLTQSASNLTANSATLNGNLTRMGGSGAAIDVYFDWGTTSAYGNSTPHQVMTAAGVFSGTVTGLAPGTTYFCRAVAAETVQGGGVATGADVVFRTVAGQAMSVSTQGASGVSGSSATLSGQLSSLGGSSTAQVYFEWGTTDSYGRTTATQTVTAPGPFSAALSALAPNTKHYFRAVAVSGGTTVYGDSNNFTTGAPTPVQVTTQDALDLTSSTSTLSGSLTSLGGNNSVDVYFQWGTTAAYGNITPTKTVSAPGTFTEGITGLVAGTTYHFRAATVAGGVPAYGADKTFAASPPQSLAVSTQAATGAAGGSATLNGSLTQLGPSPSAEVWFEWGTTASYGSSTPKQVRTAPGAFTENVTGLTPGTLYHFRAVASTGNSRVNGSDQTLSVTSASAAPTSSPSPAPTGGPSIDLLLVAMIGGVVLLFVIVLALAIRVLRTR